MSIILPSLLQAIAARQPVPGTTLNPSNKSIHIALSNGNLTATGDGSGSGGVTSTNVRSSGKLYFEVTVTTENSQAPCIGVANGSYSINVIPGTDSDLSIGYNQNGEVLYNSSDQDIVGGINAGNVVAIAVDITDGIFWAVNLTTASGWNGKTLANGNPATGVGGINISAMGSSLYALVGMNSNAFEATINFGATSFTGTVPSGFSAWG